MVAMVLQSRQDSAQFSESSLDDTIKGETDGGYTLTRRRSTRAPRKIFKTGFTDLSDEEKLSLESFYATHTTHQIFEWTHPVTLVQYSVRFEAPIVPNYHGALGYHRWDVQSISIVQV